MPRRAPQGRGAFIVWCPGNRIDGSKNPPMLAPTNPGEAPLAQTLHRAVGIDLTFVASRPTSIEEVNQALRAAAAMGRLI